MPFKPPFALAGKSSERLTIGEGGVRLLTAETAEASSPLSNLKDYQPDQWKAYVSFEINHSLPVVAGPLASGNFTGYHPRVIANSYQSLLHQQMNLRHSIKAYDPENIARDRIVGSIVAVYFPPGDNSSIPTDKDKARSVTCVASIFKQAEGVPRLLGQYLSSREPWSVSNEVVFEMAQVGIYTKGAKSIMPISEAPEEMWSAITKDKRSGRLLFGKYKGEQLVVVPGGSDGSYQCQGVGFTPDPAEKEAHIDTVRAERMQKLPEGFMALTAEAASLAMFSGGVSWTDGFGRAVRARVQEVHSSGFVRHGLDSRTASPEDPVLRVRTAFGHTLLRTLSSVRIGLPQK